MARERHPIARWIVVGAGTGGTSATMSRYVRYQRHATQRCVADPSNPVFGEDHRTGDASITGIESRIEGIGRPRVEASFIRTVIDHMTAVPDVDSVAAIPALSTLLDRKVAPTTGTNFVGMLTLRTPCRRAAGRAPSGRCCVMQVNLSAELPQRRLGARKNGRLHAGAAARCRPDAPQACAADQLIH